MTNPIDSIDRNDMDSLQLEYIQLYVAWLTDDVNCSISDMQRREKRLEEIETLVGEFVAADWSRKGEAIAKDKGMASGAPYVED